MKNEYVSKEITERMVVKNSKDEKSKKRRKKE